MVGQKGVPVRLRSASLSGSPLSAAARPASLSGSSWENKPLRAPPRGPDSVQELWSRLQDCMPELLFHTLHDSTGEGWQDSDRPVVLLAHVGGSHRVLREDNDVRQLFQGRPIDSSVQVEVRPLFPAPASCQWDGLTAARLVSVPIIGTGGSVHSARGAVASSPAKLPSPPPGKSPQLRRPSKPRWSVSAPRAPRRPRPLSAPSAEWRNSDDPPSPRESPRQRMNSQPEYDGRPGRRMDCAWAGRQTIAETGEVSMSGELLEAFGLREEYERLRTESRRRRSLLEQLLKARDSVPGSRSLGTTAMASKGVNAATLAAVGSTFAAKPEDWQKGDYCLVAARDVPKIQEAIDSLVQIEDLAAIRLQDEGATVTWTLPSAAKQLCQERRLAVGRPMLLPRKVMAESTWLRFLDIGQVAFRLLPQGDGSSSEDDATLFVWMAAPPPVSFTFTIRIGVDLAGSTIDGTFTSAPRLWRCDALHYRVDFAWSQMQVALMALADLGTDDLEIDLVVLQWHGPVPGAPPVFLQEASISAPWHSASVTTACC